MFFLSLRDAGSKNLILSLRPSASLLNELSQSNFIGVALGNVS
jgi:hypothetical protein